MPDIESLSSQVLYLAVAVTRIAAAFIVLPAFSPETIPALVRNSIFVALAMIVFLIEPTISGTQLPPGTWLVVFAKEAAIGIVIGFMFAIVLWAMEAAGQIVDAQVGMSMAQIVDPLSGHQTSLTGAFLARLSNFVFMASGGLLLMIGTILQSYVIWPVMTGFPAFNIDGSMLFAGEFGRMMVIALMFAAPALTIMLTVDLGLGLVSRYAQQLNVFSMSMSIKAWLGTFITLTLLTTIIATLLDDMAGQPERILDALRLLL